MRTFGKRRARRQSRHELGTRVNSAGQMEACAAFGAKVRARCFAVAARRAIARQRRTAPTTEICVLRHVLTAVWAFHPAPYELTSPKHHRVAAQRLPSEPHRYVATNVPDDRWDIYLVRGILLVGGISCDAKAKWLSLLAQATAAFETSAELW